MRDLDGRGMPTRVKGRPALEKRAMGLLRAARRFATCRATSRDDLAWAARVIDGLEAVLADMRTGARMPEGLPSAAVPGPIMVPQRGSCETACERDLMEATNLMEASR